MRRKLDPEQKFTRADARKLKRATAAAHADDATLTETITEEVEAELNQDEDATDNATDATAVGDGPAAETAENKES